MFPSLRRKSTKQHLENIIFIIAQLDIYTRSLSNLFVHPDFDAHLPNNDAFENVEKDLWNGFDVP